MGQGTLRQIGTGLHQHLGARGQAGHRKHICQGFKPRLKVPTGGKREWRAMAGPGLCTGPLHPLLPTPCNDDFIFCKRLRILFYEFFGHDLAHENITQKKPWWHDAGRAWGRAAATCSYTSLPWLPTDPETFRTAMLATPAGHSSLKLPGLCQQSALNVTAEAAAWLF